MLNLVKASAEENMIEGNKQYELTVLTTSITLLLPTKKQMHNASFTSVILGSKETSRSSEVGDKMH